MERIFNEGDRLLVLLSVPGESLIKGLVPWSFYIYKKVNNVEYIVCTLDRRKTGDCVMQTC